MSINLSPVQFGHPELAETLEELVLLSGVDAGTITIEITERSTMADPDRALAVLKQLKAMGFRLAIDDFGTGYSSLSYLHRFPIDILKIDRSFISNLGGVGGRREDRRRHPGAGGQSRHHGDCRRGRDQGAGHQPA